MNDNTIASELAIKFYLDYDTTYECRVNLERIIDKMLLDGISISKIKYYLSDVLDNVAFIYEEEI